MNDAIKQKIFDSTVWSVSLLFAFSLLISEASAESTRSSATNKTWAAECGSCHLAYPPNLLSASAWRRMMSGLDQHFGADASVDARAAAEIGAFLERNAGQARTRGSDSGTLRITETRWFAHKHDEIPAAAWKSPQVKTAANCGACHTGAERGDFDEDAVRIPR
jgi:nitrate/TMAO reductase-like tetraheme cytochrome c subunit